MNDDYNTNQTTQTNGGKSKRKVVIICVSVLLSAIILAGVGYYVQLKDAVTYENLFRGRRSPRYYEIHYRIYNHTDEKLSVKFELGLTDEYGNTFTKEECRETVLSNSYVEDYALIQSTADASRYTRKIVDAHVY